MWTIYKNKERLHKFKETGNSWYIYQNELDKACFQCDMAYGDFKNLIRRMISDKILHDKAFSITKNLKYDRYLHGVASMVYRFFDKKTSSGVIENENMSNKKLAEEIHKPIFKHLRKEKYTHLS